LLNQNYFSFLFFGGKNTIPFFSLAQRNKLLSFLWRKEKKQKKTSAANYWLKFSASFCQFVNSNAGNNLASLVFPHPLHYIVSIIACAEFFYANNLRPVNKGKVPII